MFRKFVAASHVRAVTTSKLIGTVTEFCHSSSSLLVLLLDRFETVAREKT